MDTKKTFIISFLMMIAVWCVPFTMHAASLYVSPASGTQTVNKNFSVTVYASSSDQALNAVSGVVSFPSNTLEVVSVSTSGSIIQQWLQQSPTFSNNAGTVSFEGIVMNPGYQGASGKIATITFRPKTTGSAQVSFSSASILANDGKGTNILTGRTGGSYTIKEAPVVVPEPKSTPKKEVKKAEPVEEEEEEKEEVVEEVPEEDVVTEGVVLIREDALSSALDELDDSIKLFVFAQMIIAFFIIFFGLMEYRQRKNVIDKKVAHKALVQEVVEETLARLGGATKARTKRVSKTKVAASKNNTSKTKDNG